MTDIKRIHRGIDGFLESLETSSLLEKRYSLAWGPAVHQDEDQAHNDALMFAVRWADEITIVIRGTSIFSPSAMILQDLLIRQKIAWRSLFPQKKDIPEQAQISESAFRGLNLLTQLESEFSKQSAGETILSFIQNLVQESPEITINVAGHSLGLAIVIEHREVSLPVVSEVINRKCTSTMVMTAIAQKLGLPFDAVWVCDYRKETK